MSIVRFARVLLIAACLALALPAFAGAAQIVNTTADEPDQVAGGACNTAAGKCSLRAAIEVTNLVGSTDAILFDGAVFEGQMVDTITLATALPAITSQVTINAGPCMTAAAVEGPCAGINGPSGQAGLKVESGSVVISDLAITGAQTGIFVSGGRDEFVAQGDWIGIELDGTAGSNGTGIFLDPESNEAFIGGTEAVRRNVISNNSVNGLQISGADEAKILGNYFGVTPAGNAAAANGKSIEITDTAGSPVYEANDNEIGATVAGTSVPCDEGCNVISGSTTGIDLNGNGVGLNEAPASGPTTIHGNFIGLNAVGTGVVANGSYGVLVGGADHVTVGGFPLGDANFIAGGGEGIVSESGSQDFIARGNRIGIAPGGGNLTPPTTAGIFVLALGVTEEASIESNLIRMAAGTGIEARFKTGRITGNEIEGGSTGILTKVGEGAGLIAGNRVEAATANGILVESPDNDIRENTVIGSGVAGIKVRNPPGVAMTGNTVGGNTAGKENVVEGSGGAAIEIREEALEPGSHTEITRNRGSANGGLFIDLVAGANEGIAVPSISTALQSSATGVALPGAKVRVFSKASAAAGELKGFLGETKADGSGNWNLTYATVPTGTLVTATQTNAFGATSELAAAVAAAADPSSGGNGGGGGGPGPGNPPVPNTKIKKGPKAKSTATTAKFKFTSTVAGSSFQCKLDKGKFKKCKSPKTYKKLKPGKHSFQVRAVGPTGLVDKTPAKRKFTILAP